MVREVAQGARAWGRAAEAGLRIAGPLLGNLRREIFRAMHAPRTHHASPYLAVVSGIDSTYIYHITSTEREG